MPDALQPLTALEAIRNRPSMYVRANDVATIADHLLRAALCQPLAELSCGSASALSIVIDGPSISITDNGAGWPVHVTPDRRRFAETMLCDLNVCRDHKAHAALAHTLCQVSLPVVVALSRTFTLETHQEGCLWRQSYHEGVAAGPLERMGVATRSGTSISFTLDATLCGGTQISSPAFHSWLATLEPTVPTAAISVVHR